MHYLLNRTDIGQFSVLVLNVTKGHSHTFNFRRLLPESVAFGVMLKMATIEDACAMHAGWLRLQSHTQNI